MAPTLTLSVTLRRAHHLNERIAEQLAHLRTEVTRLAPATTVRGFHGEDQVRQLQESATEAVNALSRHEQLAALQADIRTRLARANVEAGVSALLARIEARKKQLVLLKSFLECKPDANTLSVAALRTWTPSETNGLRGTMVSVSALGADVFERVRGERAALERELFALTDELAERNARKVALDIPVELADELGLADNPGTAQT
jgi:DNA repair exonuclease SbcCD ATPase subunit